MTLFAVTNGVVTSYVYNSDGVRTQKIHYDENAEYVGTTKYTLDGNKIVAENRLGTNIYYTYDDKGAIMGMIYGGESYLFSKNLQGDVIGIYTDYGHLVAKYEYNAFGEITAITDASGNDVSANANHIANINPFRYRGYYYDTETGFYYLQSRYYDPVVGRFISCDSVDILTATPTALTDKNLFAYCDNNPVMRKDDGGEFWHLVVGGIIGGVIGFVSSAASGGDAMDILIGTLSGAGSGVLAASGAGVVAQAVGGAAISMASNAASQVNQIVKDDTGERKFDVGDMLFDGAVGLATGACGGNGASYGNSKGIMSAGKQLFKKGFFNPNARNYYAKTAHRMGGEYVFKPLMSSLGKSAVGSFAITAKNRIKEWIGT